MRPSGRTTRTISAMALGGSGTKKTTSGMTAAWQSIPEHFQTDQRNGYYAWMLDGLVEETGAALWCHGHLHNSADYQIGRPGFSAIQRGTMAKTTTRGSW